MQQGPGAGCSAIALLIYPMRRNGPAEIVKALRDLLGR
jgi:hypothetical protein